MAGTPEQLAAIAIARQVKVSQRGQKKPNQLLKDMRHVYRSKAEHDVTTGQKALRKFLDDDPKGFVVQLTALERAYRADKVAGRKAIEATAISVSGPPKVGGEAGFQEDAGEMRVRDVIGELLGEWEDGQGQDDRAHTVEASVVFGVAGEGERGAG